MSDEGWEADGFVLARKIPCLWEVPRPELVAMIKSMGDGGEMRLRIDDETGAAWVYFKRRQ